MIEQGSEKITETLNQLGFDAMTLGNHEFDRGDDYVAGFVGLFGLFLYKYLTLFP
jgi:2',3'-cyclic-nucleotide 2'-phosphodiesterase (5'-nucleotidase family)